MHMRKMHSSPFFILLILLFCGQIAAQTGEVDIIEKRKAIEALAAEHENTNPMLKSDPVELSRILDIKGMVERFDLSKYEECLRGSTEFSKQQQYLWVESGCEALHAESRKILETEEKTPGENGPRYMKFKEDNRGAFDQCESNQKALENFRLQFSKPCIELMEIVSVPFSSKQ